MTVHINGKVYSGNTITMINNKVFIDGKDVTAEKSTEEEENTPQFIIKGDIKNLNLERGNVEIQGNVGGDVDITNGNVKVSGNIEGDVDITNGNVKATTIKGDVSVTCGIVN